MRKLYLVAYDINQDDEIRYNVSNFLSALGIRIQKSVFLLWLHPKKIKEVRDILKKITKNSHRLLIVEIDDIDTILGEYRFFPFNNIFILD